MPALTRPDRKKEKEMRKHQDRRRGVDVKVKELNCCPYQAGEEDLAGSVDFLSGGTRHFSSAIRIVPIAERKAATIRIADQTDNDRSRAADLLCPQCLAGTHGNSAGGWNAHRQCCDRGECGG